MAIFPHWLRLPLLNKVVLQRGRLFDIFSCLVQKNVKFILLHIIGISYCYLSHLFSSIQGVFRFFDSRVETKKERDKIAT